MSKTPTIDLLVSIVDNYGDMGFAVEFILAWQREYGDYTPFVIWTDDVEKMQDFLDKISPSLVIPTKEESLSPVFPGNKLPNSQKVNLKGFPSGMTKKPIQAYSIKDFGKHRKSEVALSLLHAPIPDASFFAEKSLILRIDYLSFDQSWIAKSEAEHIRSTDRRRMVELVPSPLGGAGLLPISKATASKREVAKMLSTFSGQAIDITKKWISIFSYPDTLVRIDASSIAEDSVVLSFGGGITHPRIVNLPMIPTTLFYDTLAVSDWCMVRGEVSFAYMIQTDKKIYWDMYREIGGFSLEQSEDFLRWIRATPEYRDRHERINTGADLLAIDDLACGFEGMDFHPCKHPNLIHEVKKHIDRFYFSL